MYQYILINVHTLKHCEKISQTFNERLFLPCSMIHGFEKSVNLYFNLEISVWCGSTNVYKCLSQLSIDCKQRPYYEMTVVAELIYFHCMFFGIKCSSYNTKHVNIFNTKLQVVYSLLWIAIPNIEITSTTHQVFWKRFGSHNIITGVKTCLIYRFVVCFWWMHGTNPLR